MLRIKVRSDRILAELPHVLQHPRCDALIAGGTAAVSWGRRCGMRRWGRRRPRQQIPVRMTVPEHLLPPDVRSIRVELQDLQGRIAASDDSP